MPCIVFFNPSPFKYYNVILYLLLNRACLLLCFKAGNSQPHSSYSNFFLSYLYFCFVKIQPQHHRIFHFSCSSVCLKLPPLPEDILIILCPTSQGAYLVLICKCSYFSALVAVMQLDIRNIYLNCHVLSFFSSPIYFSFTLC